MLYTIYQVTHVESGKVYIGKHQTMDLEDGYMGSGNLIRRAVKKYGIEAFKKELLHIFETEEEMNAKEAELVTNEFCLREDTYNLCPGGQGGWGYVNQNIWTKEKTLERNRRVSGVRNFTPEQRSEYSKLGGKVSGSWKHIAKLYPEGTFKNKSHSEKSCLKISNSKKGTGIGSENSQFGKKFKWMNNGQSKRKIELHLVELFVLNGWNIGYK